MRGYSLSSNFTELARYTTFTHLLTRCRRVQGVAKELGQNASIQISPRGQSMQTHSHCSLEVVCCQSSSARAFKHTLQHICTADFHCNHSTFSSLRLVPTRSLNTATHQYRHAAKQVPLRRLVRYANIFAHPRCPTWPLDSLRLR